MGFLETVANAPLWTALGVAGFAVTGVYIYASQVATRSFRLERLPAIAVGGKPAGAGGRKIKILHLSDTHLCQPESHKVHFLEQVDCAEFDLALITGDVFENYSGIQYAGKLLNGRPKYGAFAVLGNHDYYAYNWLNKTYGRLDRAYRHPREKRDVQPFIDALKDAGITTLRDQSVYLAEANVFLIGIDYPSASPETWKKLSSAAPEGALVLALQHVPYGLKNMVDANVDVAFAGHTHGGQIRIPGIGAIFTDSELPRQEASGLVRRGDTLIHVSRGLSADPKTNVRLFCPPAATVLELVY